MKYYIINPEVPGGWGKNIEVDRDSNPPKINKLHIQFNGWLGDDLITTFPVYAVTEKLKYDIETNNLLGISFDKLELSLSDTFIEIYGSERKIPKFYWAKIENNIGDDFYLRNGYKLIVSQKALNVIRKHNLNNAEVIEII